ncbi:hypothetical protein [Catenuloplanes atrovinosus]|uniref:Uncharacterized protein n=1 Tax=Catenuloplanes atrovinosus TaxID=137266 RepID=A0AAE3YKJ2_9ACTN|nr:hypothetical protein [Catenuloplanes atrovinosus]MDR7274217.1 hypothetical protein [Catenuloplanes atrovinosus]
MTLPLTPRVMDAICLEHVIPTGTGSLIVNAAPSTLDRDALLHEALTLPAIPKYTTVSFGPGMRDALVDARPGTVTWEDGIARPTGELGPEHGTVRALMYQYFRGIPGEAMDRIVERPLFGPSGEAATMSPDELGARADLMGLPVEIPADRLRPAATTLDPHRILYFDEHGRLTTEPYARMIRVVPARHWEPDPYATASPEARAEALRDGYPTARIVPAGGRVQLGLPPALTAHAHGDAVRGARQPRAEDLERLPGQVTVATYGDLLAHVAGGTATHSLVEVRAPGAAASEVFLAVHDPSGDAFLDLGTGRAALFPPGPELIRVAALPGEMTVAERVLDLAAGDVTVRPIVRPRGVTAYRTFGPSGIRAVDVLGDVPPKILDPIADAAEAIGQSVIVVGPRARTGPSRRDLLRLEKMLFQHLQNGGPAPIVLDHGEAGTHQAELTAIAGRYGAPVMRRVPGLGLDLTLKWTGAGPGDTTAVPPFTEINRETLKSVGDRQRANERVKTESALASYLSMDPADTTRLRDTLAKEGSALKALREQISALPADSALFAPHAALLDMFGRQDGLFEAALGYLDATADGAIKTMPSVTSALDREPAARSAALEELKAVTAGTLDDGASRAILDAIKLRLEGADAKAVEQAIHTHSGYLPKEGGRADFIRQLSAWQQQMPEHAEVFSEVALYVTTCP